MKAFLAGAVRVSFNTLAVAGWALFILCVLWFSGVIDLYDQLLWLIGYR